MDRHSIQFMRLTKHQMPLVNTFYKQVYKKGIANKSEQVFVLKNQQIICASRIKEVQGSLLLTGVACAVDYRGQGLANLLVNRLLKEQSKDVYCFPYPHLQNFYQKLGFMLYSSTELPEKLGIQYQRYNKRRPLLCMCYKR